jgi:hypothetical protein
VPAPGRPNAPDHETFIAEREPRAKREAVMVPERESVMEEPVMVPEREAVVDEGVMMVVGEMMMTEMVMHAAPVVHAHSAVNGQGAGRRGRAQGCNRSQCHDEFSDHRVPPIRDPVADRYPRSWAICSIGTEPELRRSFT